jgi:hypothetical protein
MLATAPPATALMVAVPRPTPMTWPVSVTTVATCELLDAQAGVDGAPIAVSWRSSPMKISATSGRIVNPSSSGAAVSLQAPVATSAASAATVTARRVIVSGRSSMMIHPLGALCL